MRKLPIAMTIALMSISAPAFAQEASVETTQSIEHAPKASALHVAMSEVAILRCRGELKLKAEQEKYWPAVASALRRLAREPQLTEAAVRRAAPAMTPFLATLDDRQRQVAMNFAQRAGLAQYASLF
jgi:hypothetical protein